VEKVRMVMRAKTQRMAKMVRKVPLQHPPLQALEL